jgi:hypothetical protein
MRAPHISRFAFAGAVLLAAGCGKKDDAADVIPPPPAATVAFRVTDVDLGKSITADKMIANKTENFAPMDTVFVSVGTEGSSPGAAIKARFTFQDGQVVEESTQTVAPTGPARTEFHIVKPSGWPEGKYKVEITVDGALAGSKDFEVKRG